VSDVKRICACCGRDVNGILTPKPDTTSFYLCTQCGGTNPLTRYWLMRLESARESASCK
jgi:hypothetical protein